jgi:hypothetical protein
VWVSVLGGGGANPFPETSSYQKVLHIFLRRSGNEDQREERGRGLKHRALDKVGRHPPKRAGGMVQKEGRR